MKYETYDELIDMVARLRNDNRDLADVELDNSDKQIFRIDPATLCKIYGVPKSTSTVRLPSKDALLLSNKPIDK